MKNTILIVLLTASLGLNAWLALARTSSRDAVANSAAGAAETGNGARIAQSAGKKADEAARPFIWRTNGTSDDELRTLAADLRAAGFPPSVVTKIVGTALRERVFAKVAELPFWQLNTGSRTVRKAQAEATRELQRLQQELLGAAGSPVATLDPNQRRERYGDLPDDKVAALLQIDRDYQDVAADLAPNGIMSSEESMALQEQFKTVEKERLADIKAALGSEAYAEYERQNSTNAGLVMRGLRELKVTEEEYDALLAAQKARNPTDSSQVFPSSADPTALPATYAFNDQVRALLGEERAHAYLKSADSNYGRIAQFTEQQSLPPATTYQLYQLQNEAQLAMQQLRPREGSSGGSPASADIEKARQAFTELNSRLDTLLGAEAAKTYRSQGNGAVFRTFAPRSAPGTPTPAVRLPGTGGG